MLFWTNRFLMSQDSGALSENARGYFMFVIATLTSPSYPYVLPKSNKAELLKGASYELLPKNSFHLHSH